MSEAELKQTIARLSDLVRQVTGDDICPAELGEASRFVEDVGMESINRLMLMTMVEREFGVDLEKHMPALIDLHTIGDTARFIRSLRTA